jgi:hypothetical protein
MTSCGFLAEAPSTVLSSVEVEPMDAVLEDAISSAVALYVVPLQVMPDDPVMEADSYGILLVGDWHLWSLYQVYAVIDRRPSNN